MTSRLSIVHLTTFLQGGAGRAITDLACAQHDAGHDVLVVTSAAGEEWYGNYPQYLERLRESGVGLIVEDSLFKRDERLNVRVLERLIDVRPASRTDVVHAHAATPARIGRRYAATTDRTIPVLQTQHGWGTNKTPEQSARDLSILHELDGIVVTSGSTGRLLRDAGVPCDLITTIPCGLSPLASAPAPGLASAAVASLRARDRRVVGCVGSVTANKNQSLLVEALARTAVAGAVFVGEGGSALAARSRELGVEDRVHVAGHQPDADQWMPEFDLLVVPSLTEGQGLVVLEAFRAGVPVVASDIPPLRELVRQGRTGWLFDPQDAGALAAALDLALAVPASTRAAIIEQARHVFDERYTLAAMVAAHEALYRRKLRT